MVDFAALMKRKQEQKVMQTTQHQPDNKDENVKKEEGGDPHDARQGETVVVPTVKPKTNLAATFANIAKRPSQSKGEVSAAVATKTATVPPTNAETSPTGLLASALSNLVDNDGSDNKNEEKPISFADQLSGALAKVKNGNGNDKGVKTIVARAAITSEQFTYPEQPDKYTPEEVKELQESFRILENSLTDKEMVSNSVRDVLSRTKRNPHLAYSILAPEDIGLLVQGLRASYNVAVRIKRERADKKQQKDDATMENVKALMAAGFKL